MKFVWMSFLGNGPAKDPKMKFRNKYWMGFPQIVQVHALENFAGP